MPDVAGVNQPLVDRRPRTTREALRTPDEYSNGWRTGASDVLNDLERRGCFTTARARRQVERIRAALSLEVDE